MILSSLPFLFFAAVILILYSIVPEKFRWALLLMASYFFYACLGAPYLILAIAVSTIISYFIGMMIHKESSNSRRLCLLWTGTLANLALLIFMKYRSFLLENLKGIYDFFHIGMYVPLFNQLVTIGVSYYVFQAICYLADIYLEIQEPETRLGRFALYMSFFPKLLQGPIERGGNLLPQLNKLSPITRENLYRGINLFIWGLLKKTVIADRLATFVDPIYNNVHGNHGPAFIIATYLFAFQIYFDFSGYTDMAMGIARCFNIGLTQNFNSPYMATSVAEFWRRWHISFSSWILDYIFKPLQFHFRDWRGTGTVIALMVTFLASGIWHGASWCFITWGGLHGVYLSTSFLIRQPKQKIFKKLHVQNSKLLALFQRVVTFHLICLAWVFFRASSIHDAVYIIRHSIIDINMLIKSVNSSAFHLFPGKTAYDFLTVFMLILVPAVVKSINKVYGKNYIIGEELSFISEVPHWQRGILYGFACYMIVFLGVNTQSFIYLNF